MAPGKLVVGLSEVVTIEGKKGRARVTALFDTGATRSSIDEDLAETLGIEPSQKSVKVKNPSLPEPRKRPLALAKVKVNGKAFVVEANLQKRRHMSHRVILGRDVILGNFVVDVEQSHSSPSLRSVKGEERKRFMEPEITLF